MASPTDARERLAAVARTALLDTPPEEAFDRLTRMAARLLGAPVSLITVVTDDRRETVMTIDRRPLRDEDEDQGD